MLNLAVDKRGQQRHAGADRLNQRRFTGRQFRADAGKIGAYCRLAQWRFITRLPIKAEKSINPLKLNQPELTKEGWEQLEQTGSVRSLETSAAYCMLKAGC